MAFLQKLLSPKVLIPIIAILVVLLIWAYWKPTTPPTGEGEPSVEETSPTPSEEGTEEEEPPPEVQTGTIEGSLSYPSEFIPSHMTICAEDTSTKKQYCTKTHIQNQKYTYGVGYKIEDVPSGSYLVFAYFPGGEASYSESYRAYYSKFVTCGMSVDCASHDPIVVTVAAGQAVTGIDPQDWYVF